LHESSFYFRRFSYFSLIRLPLAVLHYIFSVFLKWRPKILAPKCGAPYKCVLQQLPTSTQSPCRQTTGHTPLYAEAKKWSRWRFVSTTDSVVVLYGTLLLQISSGSGHECHVKYSVELSRNKKKKENVRECQHAMMTFHAGSKSEHLGLQEASQICMLKQSRHRRRYVCLIVDIVRHEIPLIRMG